MFCTIKEQVTAKIEIKKSKFIANIFQVNDRNEAEKIIKEITKKYYDARHNCYAYIINEKINDTNIEKGINNKTENNENLQYIENFFKNNKVNFKEDKIQKIQKFSDDGEPSGTAGAPILDILKNKNLSNVLVIVTRYFGGILLGTGGLVKAYTDATNEALEKAEIVKKEYGKKYKFQIKYEDLKTISYICKQLNINITNIEFLEKVSITLVSKQENIAELQKKIEENKLQKSEFEFLRNETYNI